MATLAEAIRRFQRRALAISPHDAYKAALLATYAAYLVLGNLPRPGVYHVRGGGPPVLEVALALLAALGLLPGRARLPRGFRMVMGATLASSGIGYLIHGPISFLPGLYAVRLVLILGGSVVVARVMHERWGNDAAAAFRFLTILFVVAAGTGWVLWATFPDTGRLLETMRTVGLSFDGEPHQNRMVGPLLDPNFFGNILVLCIGMTVGLTMVVGNSWFLGAYALFVATLLQTFSRSSVLGLGVWLVTYTLLQVTNRERPRASWKVYAALILVGIGTAFLFQRSVSTIAHRITAVPVDPSALHRVGSLKDAARLILQPHVFFLGLGYNFLPFVLERKYGLNGFDASVANFCVAFGLPLGGLVAAAICRWALRVAGTSRVVHPIFGDVLGAYLVASVAMSMFTNLLLFAPFLWTVVPLACYLQMAAQGTCAPQISPGFLDRARLAGSGAQAHFLRLILLRPAYPLDYTGTKSKGSSGQSCASW